MPHRRGLNGRIPAALRGLLLFSLTILTLGIPREARADGAFIPAANREDMAFDQGRHLLYITTSDGFVLRYNVQTNAFLAPYDLGGNLRGIDISPDGKHLAVADLQRATNRLWFWDIDLQTDTSQKVYFTREYGEGGTYMVAYGSDGAVLVSSNYEGSGWVPLRRYDPATGTTNTVAPSISQAAMLIASADRSAIAVAEPNSSSGPFGRYRVADKNWLEMSGSSGTGWYNFEIGVSRDGSQYALPTYGGTFINDKDLNGIGQIGQYAGVSPIGVVYSPVSDIVYFAFAQTSQVRAYNTNTLRQVTAYNFENAFGWNGNTALVEGRLRMSPDGAFLFCSVDNGVRCLQVTPFQAADLKKALRIAAGFEMPTGTDQAHLNVVPSPGDSITVLDAAHIARKIAGLEYNP